MVRQIDMGYGIWESLAHLAGDRLGGHEKVWVTGVYGLSQVWIKTEATVSGNAFYVDDASLHQHCYTSCRFIFFTDVLSSP